MNVGIVTTWSERGGATVSRAYAEALTPKHNVFIYARGDVRRENPEPEWNRKVTFGKPVGYADTAVDWNDFQSWIAANQIQLVIFNEQQSWRIVLEALRKLDIVVGAYVDYYTTETYRFFWLYDFLLCNTQRHYSVFKEHPSAVYIPWGTDLQVFKPKPTLHPNHQIAFFHSCGLSPYRKGTDLLCKAFKKVSGNVRLIIHSQGLIQAEDVVVSAISADPRISLIEKEVSAPGLYHLGDVYAYPTRLEGIGLTIAEALASGLPVITTNAPPMNEFVADNLNGKLVDVASTLRRKDNYYWPMSICDETKLARAMQFFVNNPSETVKYQQRASQYAMQKLDWKKNAQALPEIIEHFAHRPPDNELMKTVSEYDNRTNRYPPWIERLVPTMRKVGIDKVRRTLRERLD